jgi:hypothetical protein
MLTKNEITALNLSPTKKDFVQIWNELLEVAGRLSERWDPTSTNESDPGIVILKALTGIADKLNYSIDKNTLEAFMPTAAQEESMRKLCDMLGYNVKYYRSAETTVTIKYYNSDPSDDEKTALQLGLPIPKFTVITNGDQDINYFIIDDSNNPVPGNISLTNPYATFRCMEGQIVKCESTADNNVITVSQISDNNRFYLPEYQIAENGIFVYNVAIDNLSGNVADGDTWEKVDNLNIQARGSRVFKFGYDSYEGRPYLEFPEDYSELINDGLFIYYTRTSGANGNISARTLTQFELPSSDGWDKVSAESFSVENAFSATTGANIETIDQAYNNFKKTVGTFETLVTCRDYMNKIYNMVDDATGKYLVSNALVTDIRTDLNRAVTICSCDDAGIFYKETPLINTKTTQIIETINDTKTIDTEVVSLANKPVFNPNRSVNGSNWFLGSEFGMPLAKADFIDENYRSNFSANTNGTVKAEDGFWWIIQGGSAFRFKTVLPVETVASEVVTPVRTITNSTETTLAIDHFDLVIYPFKSYNQIRNNVKDIQAAYDRSFEYSSNAKIKNILDQSDVKTIAHNLIAPRRHDIVSINNYLRLNAIIGTTTKITVEEGALLIDKIKIALANAFNMRELDFGDEIPFDSILSVIENADTRINVVSLAEPALYTTYSVYEGQDSANNPILREYAVASDWLTEAYASTSDRFEHTNATSVEDHTFNKAEAKKIYNRLAVRNVLAGRVPLFKYNTTFHTSFSDGAYRVTEEITKDSLPESLRKNVDPTSENPTGINPFIPNEENPFTIHVVDGITYTGQWSSDKTIYTKTFVPDEYSDNVVTKNADDDDNYTELETKCEIFVDRNVDGTPTGAISNITLADGEFIKFRAPNFVTDKTYPAYVNYHLKLDKSLEKAASSAEAVTLYNLLANTSDIASETRRNKLFKYFIEQDVSKQEDERVVKKVTLSQTVYGQTAEVAKGVTLKINDKVVDINPSQILDNSGFMKLLSGQASLSYENGDQLSPSFINELKLPKISLTFNEVTTEEVTAEEGNTPYVFTVGTLDLIKTIINNHLEQYTGALPSKDWTISYEFEYIPFEPATLPAWDSLIKSTAAEDIFGFTPEVEYGTALWRAYAGTYLEGKYILSGGIARLLSFTNDHFGLLDTNRLKSVYLAKDLGEDAIPMYIRNNEEYQLRRGEYLFIEYTPSTTTEESNAQTQESIKEIFTEGKIIKPSGFGGIGLIDSSEQENAAPKTVTFDGHSEPIKMYSLGANEQIAIRERSEVKLNGTTLSNSPTIYFYKNFNGCEELEDAKYRGTNYNKDTGERSYTLKDGEYIFYTDQNKAEFAYFTSGTEVILTGNLDLPKCDLIDISTIFDSGIQEIPWISRTLDKNKGVVFREFQYITLGPNDTLESLFLHNTSAEKLDKNWQKCTDATYTVAGSDELSRLSKINLSDTSGGNGWEACSVLELNVSPNSLQTLRTTDKVQTSVTLYKTPAINVVERDKIELKATDANHPLSFKTNLSCLSSSSSLKIDDVYSNPINTKSFELKILAEQPPVVVATAQNKLVPYVDSDIVDITDWTSVTKKTFATKGFGELWTRISLGNLAKESAGAYDNALKLSISVLPNTYGIFSIYLNYVANVEGVEETNIDTSSIETWIDLLPGSSMDDISLLNVPAGEVEQEKTSDYVRLKLKPGINCVRVNKTCDLFIKTYADESVSAALATSALYLDDLRLVDCQPIEYTDNGEKKSQKTQGLNLEQIGYLATADTTPLTAFDMQIRRKLREDYTSDALIALENYAQAEAKNLTIAKDSLQTIKPKLQKLLDFTTDVKEEIDALLSNSEESAITQLFAKYKELYIDLEQEKALEVALADDKNIVILEKQLADLLASLEAPESLKQKLLGELDILESAASDNSNSFTKELLSKGAILDDFEAVADSTDIQLVNDLKLFSIKEVNAEYANKLAELESAIKAVGSEEAYSKLMSVLEELNIAKHAKLVVQIQALVSANQSTLAARLEEALSASTGALDLETSTYVVNYATLRTILVSLREYLLGADINELLSEIDLISGSAMENSDKYGEIIHITDELTKLLDANGEVGSGNYASLVAALTGLLVSVQTKIDTNSTGYDSAIYETIDALATNVNDIYLKKLSELLINLQSTLTDVESSYTATVESLKDSEIESVQAILSNLEGYNSVRFIQMNTIEAFGTTAIRESYLSLPYGVLSVVSIWPSYMKRAYNVGVAKLYEGVRKIINNPTSTEQSLFIADNFYTDNSRAVLRQTLTSAANLAAFQQLFSQAKTLTETSAQSSKRAELINVLGALMIPSPESELYKVLDTIRNDTDVYAKRNAVLQQLISAWLTTSTVTEKQSIMSKLREELAEAIRIDTQLVEISAKLLFPSVLLFSGYEDSFYDKLRTFVEECNRLLLADNIDIISIITDNLKGSIDTETGVAYTHDIITSLLTALNNDDITTFAYFGKRVSNSLLPTACLDILADIYDTSIIQSDVKNSKNCTLLSILQNNKLVVAWENELNIGEDKFNIWVDSSGNYYQKYIDSTWVPYPNNESEEQLNWLKSGSWFDNNNLWRTYENKLVEVQAKRYYSNGVWKDNNDKEIKVRNDDESFTNAEGVTTPSVIEILENLFTSVSTLGEFSYMTEESRNAYVVAQLEVQLLNEILELDKNREFYYNVPIEANVAIDFNEGDSKLNTLMNPAVNYDINNVNNNFVISKIDINYLNTGLQIARSSKLG